MSSYYTPSKGVVNRYWKRPKPRVYECNVRDVERFYKQSYKDYLDAKEYSAKRAAEDRSRIGDDITSRWGIRRSNSLMESGSDPVSRDYSSLDGPSRSSLLTSSSSRQYSDDSSSGGSSFRTATTQNNELASMEDRLQRIQRLRSELGLPVESNDVPMGGASGVSTSKVTFQLPTSPTTAPSSFKLRQTSPGPRERRGKTVDVGMSSSSYSSRSTNRSRGSDLTSDSYLDSLPNENNKFSKYSSKYNNDEDAYSVKETRPRQIDRASSYSRDDSDKYTYKSSLKKNRKYDTDDDSFSFSRPSDSKNASDSTASYKSTRKVTIADDDDDCDADAYLNSIKKKFPTSDEILERIKKMDSEM